MRWFGKRAGREGARPVLGRGWSARGGDGGWPGSYEAQVRDAYLGNAVAQRAVRLVTEAVGSAPVYAGGGPAGAGGGGSGGESPGRADDGTAPGRVDGEAALALVTAPGMMEAAAAQLLLHGNAYLQLATGGDGRPAALYPLRPERVTVALDARGWPAGYRYRVDGVETVLDPVGERGGVIHLRRFHPLDDHGGLGCLGAAAGAVAIHNAATRWHKALLDNAARPSGALVYDPGEKGATLSPDQYDRLRAEMDANFAGAGNAGRPMLLEGGLRWQPLSLSPADMDFVGTKAAAAREIALAFGVPPMLLGLPGDATYANYREANRALWRSTVLPLTGAMLAGIGAGLAGWWPGLTLSVDPDLIPALAEDRERLWRQVSAAEFLTREEKREMLGFGA